MTPMHLSPDSGKKEKTRFAKILKNSVLAVICAFLTIFSLTSIAQMTSLRQEKDLFFSVDRVALKPELVALLERRDDGRAQKDIAEFAGYYGDGCVEYSRGNFSFAEADFKKARLKWPEYFYADFAIAVTLEAKGEYGKAARYYKSYLNKLREYKKGHYGISAPLIGSFASGRVEDHDFAYGAVKKRLSAYGIDLDKARPAYSFNIFPVAAFSLFLSAGIFFVVFHGVVPFIKKKLREKNAPEGFWACSKCGTFTPDLSLECSICGTSKPMKFKGKDPGKTNENQ